jgi:branched-chain amino acid transport system permease protein
MVVIGGMGTATGPLVGAVLVEVTSEALRAVGVRHMLVFALIVILIGRFFRDGLVGLVARPARRTLPAAVHAAAEGAARQ